MGTPATKADAARSAAAINFAILTHGVQPTVGFAWQGTFIHDPFADPQYGALPVDPVQQYGDDYLQSIFVKEPAIALNTARQQLRDVANQDITHYCVEHRIDRTDIIAIIEECCDVPVPAGDNVLATLTDEQVVIAWASVDTNPRFHRLARE